MPQPLAPRVTARFNLFVAAVTRRWNAVIASDVPGGGGRGYAAGTRVLSGLIGGVRTYATGKGWAQATGTKTMADHSILTTASDLVEAVQLAERNFGQANASADDYCLAQARRLLAGDAHCSGNQCWRLTFKLARLIPTSLSARLGAGGELFFTVDVERGEATLTGHGE